MMPCRDPEAKAAGGRLDGSQASTLTKVLSKARRTSSTLASYDRYYRAMSEGGGGGGGILEALNQPPLVAGAGVAVVAALPAVERAIVSGDRISFGAVKLVNCLLFGLNVWATSRPGRIDGQLAEEMQKRNKERRQRKKSDDGDDKKDDVVLAAYGSRGRTLVSPSGWAFAIWGPIFLGELVFVVASAASVSSSGNTMIGDVIRRASGGFAASQIVQSLWAAAFRPKYEGASAFVSAGLLGGIALSLNRAHAAITAKHARNSYTFGEYLLYFLPISLHFGWTTAASLVNLNGSYAAIVDDDASSAKRVAWLGHASAVAATAVGVVVTVVRQAPVYGGVIAWALTACSTGMQARLLDEKETAAAKRKKDGDDGNRIRPGIYGARTQMWLCRWGRSCLSRQRPSLPCCCQRRTKKPNNGSWSMCLCSSCCLYYHAMYNDSVVNRACM